MKPRGGPRRSRSAHPPVGDLRLDLTVRRQGLHLEVRGRLGGRGSHRLRRAMTLLERSPRGGTLDLGEVDRVDDGGLAPLREAASRPGAVAVVVTALSPQVDEVVRDLGLPADTPLRLDGWRVEDGRADGVRPGDRQLQARHPDDRRLR